MRNYLRHYCVTMMRAIILIVVAHVAGGQNALAQSSPSMASCSFKNDSFTLSCNDWSIRMRGRMHLDIVYAADRDKSHKTISGIDLRRARIGFAGTIFKDFAFKSEVGFSNNAVSLKSFYLDYKGVKNLTLRVGHHNPPYGLLVLTSSNDIYFMERVLNPDNRYYGMSAFYQFNEKGQVGIGIHGDTASNTKTQLRDNNEEADFGVAGRLTFAPILNDEMVLHTGFGVHYVNERNSDVGYASRAPFSNAVIRDRVYNVKPTGADYSIDLNPELSFVWKSMGIQSEFLYSIIAYKEAGRSNEEVMGYYVQANYWLTGEMNVYDAKNGHFESTKPRHNVMSGGAGALGIAVRYDGMIFTRLKTTPNAGNYRGLTVNLTWIPIKNIRVMTEFVQAWRNAELCGCDGGDEPRAGQMRIQLAF